MYIILINNDNSVTHSVRERLMQRSSMVDKLCFLADIDYKGHDMRDFVCTLEYRLPISGEYKVKILSPSDELYKGHIQYLMDSDINITKENGDVNFKLTFSKLDMDADGNPVEFVREIESSYLTIIPVENWANYIPNTNLDELVQMILANQATISQIRDYAAQIYATKADNIKVDTTVNEMYLTANGDKIGDSVDLDKFGSDVANANKTGLIKVVI